jgi:transcription initiation factor TFIIB
LAAIYRFADKLGIQRAIKEEAAHIYTEARKNNLTKGTPVGVIVPATLYAAFRVRGIPRTLREVLKEGLYGVNNGVKDSTEDASNAKNDTNAARLRVARFYRHLVVNLRLKPYSSNPVAYVPKIAEGMRISNKTQGLAIQILNNAKHNRLASGKDPSVQATAALYMASLRNNEKISQKKISQVAGIADATLRHNCKVLRKQLNLERPGNSADSLEHPNN